MALVLGAFQVAGRPAAAPRPLCRLVTSFSRAFWRPTWKRRWTWTCRRWTFKMWTALATRLTSPCTALLWSRRIGGIRRCRPKSPSSAQPSSRPSPVPLDATGKSSVTAAWTPPPRRWWSKRTSWTSTNSISCSAWIELWGRVWKLDLRGGNLDLEISIERQRPDWLSI